MNRMSIIAASGLAVLLSACQIDLGLSCAKVAGDYCLSRFEDGRTFHLQDRRSYGEGGGGAIDGTAVRIGWTPDVILVERRANFSSDPDGWMRIDVAEKRVEGPISDEDAEHLASTHGIELLTVEEAWARLKRDGPF